MNDISAELGTLREKPIWLLRRDEIAAMPEQDQRWIADHMIYLEKSGHLAVMLANPEGTIFEQIFTSDGWKMQPVCNAEWVCAAMAAMRAVVQADESAHDLCRECLARPVFEAGCQPLAQPAEVQAS